MRDGDILPSGFASVIIMQKAAILVSKAERLQEGLFVGKSLAGNDMQVQILLTDPVARPSEIEKDDVPCHRSPRDSQRFTNRLDVAGHLGFNFATLAQIALMLKEADVVIPY
jgi:hypothetical protein